MLPLAPVLPLDLLIYSVYTTVHVQFGVHKALPVSGPLLYIIYTADIGALLTYHGLLHQLYADMCKHTLTASDCAVAMVLQLYLAMDALSGRLVSNCLNNNNDNL